MNIYVTIKLKLMFILTFSMLLIGCGGDTIVEEIIEKYENGNTKVLVKFKSETNVLERYTYGQTGELIYLEIDSLMKRDFLKNYLQGLWVIKFMIVDEDTLYNGIDSLKDVKSQNIFSFSNDSLKVDGWKYKGRYRLKYSDSLKIDLKGIWSFDDKNFSTYRLNQVNDQDTIVINSYSEFIWKNYLNTIDKDEVVIFNRYQTATNLIEMNQ